MILRCALTALVLASGSGPAVPPPLHVGLAPASIDATGATDVTDALNQFFAGVPDGDVISLRPGANYRVDGTLELFRRHDIVLDGRGARIFAGTEGARDRSQLSIDNGSRIVIRNLVIKGANPVGGIDVRAWRPDKAFQHGIRIRGARDVELDRLHVTDAFGDLVSVGRSQDRRWSERIWVHDSYLARNGRQGVAVTAAEDVVIEHNTITQTRRATIDLEPDTPTDGAKNVFILDNDIGPGLLRFVAAHGNGPVDNVVIAYNRLRGRDLAVDVEAPSGTRRSNFYVVGNTSDKQSAADPLRFTRIDGVVVQDNLQPVQSLKTAILATDVCGLAVQANAFIGVVRNVNAVGAACPQPGAAPLPAPPGLIGRTLPRPSNSEAAPDHPVPRRRTPADRTPHPGADARPRSSTTSRTSGPSATASILRTTLIALVLAVLVVGLAWWYTRRRRSQATRPTSDS